jgi:murein L,D-transpeptidase YcbB/YkuD
VTPRHAPPPATGPVSSSDLQRALERLIEGRDDALGPLSEVARAELRGLYQPAPIAPLWLDAAGRPTRNADDALGMLSRAVDEGLDPADYHPGLLRRVTTRLSAASQTPSREEMALFDVVVSSGMLRYLRHLHNGRVDPRTLGLRLDAPRDRHDFAALLRSALVDERLPEAAVRLRPPLAQYRLLRAMLARYRSVADEWASVPPLPFTVTVHPGDRYAGNVDLHRRLIAFGDLPPDATRPEPLELYDAALAEGVERFQARHGLQADGVLGRHTIAALRVPLTWRIRQIELALERLRWLPHLGDARLIALNIPMFRLWAWNTLPASGAPLFGMDVIVGRALDTETPVFVEEMREVIFRPYWNVPRSILRNELLPAIERDPDYLRREQMEIVLGSGDDAQRVELTPDALAGLRRGVFRLRQRPGPKNALGLIKFVFPNREDVYMHGTPAQTLFANSRRDFSHGCVRVADPIALAEWVLQDRPEWTPDRIREATAGSRTVHVRLPRPIQVVLFYTTAVVIPEDGAIRFAEDIYGHDARLDRALAARTAAE